jgi:diacylglycerol kinase family enzyme
VCVIRKIGLLEFLRHVPRVIAGKHANLPPVKLFRTASLRVGTPGLPLAVHLDGEIRHYDTDSVDITLVPERLGVLCGT